MRGLFLATILFMTGCAGSYKSSYVIGATVKQFATESYSVYSSQFNSRLEECDPEKNLSVTTKSELDECMGDFRSEKHDEIEDLTRMYHATATVHSDVMMRVDATPGDRVEANKKLINSAIALIQLLPEGDKLVARLRKLVGGI